MRVTSRLVALSSSTHFPVWVHLLPSGRNAFMRVTSRLLAVVFSIASVTVAMLILIFCSES